MKKLIAFILAFIATTMCACSNKSTQYNVRYTFIFGSSNIALSFVYSGGDYEDVFLQIVSKMDELNSQINVNDPSLPDTDILQLNNAAAYEEVKIGYHLYYLLQKSKEIYVATDKAFNVAAYPLAYLFAVDTASLNGYVPPSFIDSDIIQSSVDGFPLSKEVQRVKDMCNLDGLTLFTKNDKYYAQKAFDSLKVDLGGIAKGYAADLCAKIMRDNGVLSGYINISGNIFTCGKSNKKSGKWEFGITDPKNPFGAIICAAAIDADTTILTSGDYQRYRVVSNPDGDGYTYLNHMIDTEKGYPYGITTQLTNDDSRIISCTIIGLSSMETDAYATAVCIKGLDDGISMLNKLGLSAIIFTNDNKMAVVGNVNLIDKKEANAYKSKYTMVYPTL